MDRNGSTHLGFILSFVIFIMFVVFMFSAIEPFLKTEASKQSLLDLLRFSLVDDFKVEDLVVLTISIDADDIGNNNKDCLNINRGTLSDLSDKDDLIIKDKSGNVLNYEFQGGGNSMWIGPNMNLNEDVLLKIYHAGTLGNSQGDPGQGCEPVDDSNVILGSLVEENGQILQSNILALKDKYELDCGETIKTELGIPEGNEFTFSFKLSTGEIIEPEICGGIIPDTSVYATTFPVQYLDNDANYQIGFLTIKVW